MTQAVIFLAVAGASVVAAGGSHGAGPALTVALALLAGVLAQSLAHHLRLPGIVLLLGAGVLLGPDGLRVVTPGGLGDGLQMLVQFAVAVVLFEGGMNLDLRRLRKEATVIRRLVSIGALVTGLGGAVAARLLMQWDWLTSLLFGSLIIVTGPTVITPLLRRIKARKSVATILEAEGVLIDPVGAIIAVLALEAVLPAGDAGWTAELSNFGLRLGIGAALGLAGGLLLGGLLRFRRLVPEEMQNVMALAVVLALFQASNALLEESGIMAVTVAGLVFGNLRTHALRELKEFKEQLTVMLIGMLFVLLAADVRLDQVAGLGRAGVLTVLALMVVVRPLNVALCTWGSGLGWRERVFLAWLAPRGIVAAAVATLFAQSLGRAGLPGGEDLKALVFMVIAMTVLVQGLTGGLVARLLGLQRPSDNGYVILGASPLGLALGEALRQAGDEAIFIDSNPEHAHAAEEAGFKIVFGNALEERTLLRAELDTRAGCIGCTSNEEVNLLFVRRARDDFRVPRLWIARERHESAPARELVQRVGARTVFVQPRDLEMWAARLVRGEWQVRAFDRERPRDRPDPGEAGPLGLPDDILPMVLSRGGRRVPVDETMEPKQGDRLYLLLPVKEDAGRIEALAALGWAPMTPHGATQAAGEDQGAAAIAAATPGGLR